MEEKKTMARFEPRILCCSPNMEFPNMGFGVRNWLSSFNLVNTRKVYIIFCFMKPYQIKASDYTVDLYGIMHCRLNHSATFVTTEHLCWESLHCQCCCGYN